MLLLGIMAVAAAGCSAKSEHPKDSSATAVLSKMSLRQEGDGADGSLVGYDIPYEQLLYAKLPAAGIRDGQLQEEPPLADRELLAAYEPYRRAVPGGFIVKQDEEHYYICVSIGKTHTPSEGFDIAGIAYTVAAQGDDSLLVIRVREQHNEPSPEGKAGNGAALEAARSGGTVPDGGAFVTSLIRIPKSALPAGAEVAGISMLLAGAAELGG
ncbi:hypothetical protein GCM10020370_13550 [Paenibacillus hodogayensis]